MRTLRSECPDHVLLLNERHLRSVLDEYVAYYNTGRPHRSLGLVPPLPSAPSGRPSRAPAAPDDRFNARPVLGGLHHVYERAA